jgi:hypothetical protein
MYMPGACLLRVSSVRCIHRTASVVVVQIKDCLGLPPSVVVHCDVSPVRSELVPLERLHDHSVPRQGKRVSAADRADARPAASPAYHVLEFVCHVRLLSTLPSPELQRAPRGAGCATSEASGQTDKHKDRLGGRRAHTRTHLVHVSGG